MTRIHSVAFSLLSATLLLASKPQAQPRRLDSDHDRLRHSARNIEKFLEDQSDITSASLKGGFEWHRHGGRGYVRFLLSSSIDDPESDGSEATPIMIGIPKGDTPSWDEDEKALKTALNDKTRTLSTMPLTNLKDDPTRYSSTFFIDFDSTEYQSGNGDDYGGWPIQVTTSFGAVGTTVGWQPTTAKNRGSDGFRRMKWTDDVTSITPANQLRVHCKSWWYEHEGSGIWHRPQYYGRRCQLRIARKNGNLPYCITADDTEEPPTSQTPLRLKYEPCKASKENQLWHIQSTALEWPKYFKNGKDGWRHWRDPLELFKCEPYCASSTTDTSP